MASEENIKVAVRVRPFNKVEKETNAKLVIQMNGPKTTIFNPSKPDQAPHQFQFDHSYWSNSGFKTEPDGYLSSDPTNSDGKDFCDQKRIFNDLGAGIVKNAWGGYNSSLFAYGQTGSGKSFSVVGYGVNEGIVPQFCQTLFKEIEDKKVEAANKTEYHVTCSMLEIYNEKVTDLLDLKSKKATHLKIRKHPERGFYVEGLSSIPAPNYKKIEQLMHSGITNRTIASTNMNATSSRAHTIFGINFSQKFKNENGQLTEKTAVVNIVDLAGSERVSKTGSSGDRFKEGTMINKSLLNLGECIAALAKNYSSGTKSHIPFRNSVLTQLLQSALGGNSKTIMIAAISPADCNYEESLSTLRYADRAKQIKTTAKVNENDTATLIRQLREENEKYKKQMEKEGQAASQEQLEEYMSLLKENQRKMAEMEKSYEERLKEADDRANKIANSMVEIENKKKNLPHIYNLNMDPQLTGHIFFFFQSTPIVVGKAENDADGSIQLKGPSIMEKHAIIDTVKETVTLTPVADNARILLNGKQVTQTVDLHHNDRLLFGTTQYFVYVNPNERDRSGQSYPAVSFEMAQEEIGKQSGFDEIGSDDTLLREDLLEILPAVDEVNAISEELQSKKKFSIKILHPMSCGDVDNQSQVHVRVLDLESGVQWFWNRQKFFNRKYIMQEIYQNFVNGEDWKVPQEQDPFYDDPEAPFLIGTASVYLGALAFNMQCPYQTDIVDHDIKKTGILDAELLSCNSDGNEYHTDDNYYMEPEEMVGKSLYFKIKIIRAQGLPNKFTEMFAKFQLLFEKESNQTHTIANTINPEWNYIAMFSYPVVTKQLVDYLKDQCLFVQIWGSHKLAQNKLAVINKSDKKREANSENSGLNLKQAKLMLELNIMNRKQEKLKAQLDGLRRMIETAEGLSKKKLSVQLIRKIYESSNSEQIESTLELIKEEKDDSDDENDPENIPTKSSPVSSNKNIPTVESKQVQSIETIPTLPKAPVKAEKPSKPSFVGEKPTKAIATPLKPSVVAQKPDETISEPSKACVVL